MAEKHTPEDVTDEVSARREMESEIHKGTEQDIHAAQSSSPATGSGATVGSFTPDYEGKGDAFLGEGAHVVSGTPRLGPQVDDDMRDSPALVLDAGRDPHPGKDVGVVRSNEPGDAGQGSDDLRTYEDQGPEGTR
jgi:hypothetical protein